VRLDAVTGMLADTGYGLGWAAIRRMPEPVAAAFFRSVADRTYERDGRQVQQLRRNLARVVPDAAGLEDLVHEGLRRYLRYWLEAFRLPAMTPADIASKFHLVEGEDRLSVGVASGRGVICALPHMGNWDLAGAWVNQTHAPLTTVVERLKPESLFDRFVDFRRSLGMEVLALTGGESPFRTLLERLKTGHLVCLVADRDLTSSGLPVQFFGQPARMPGGPAALAVASGALLFPASLWVEGDSTVGCIHPQVVPPSTGDRPAQVAVTTQAVARVFERAVAEHPADWHMLQPLWEADLESREPAQKGVA
jgi:phosphatidylinositol dimannoside acyltransferase